MTNRYAAQVIAGSALTRALKRLKWWIVRPRDLARLGEGSRVIKPFRRVNAQCIEIGERVIIGRNCLVQPLRSYLDQTFAPKIVIGDDCYIGADCQLHSIDLLEIGRGCVLSDQVYISDTGHGMNPNDGLIMDRPILSKGPVRLGEGCFIGYASVVLGGVSLGKHCVVGTRSVVTRSFDDYTMVAGNPARPIAKFEPVAGQWVRIVPSAVEERST